HGQNRLELEGRGGVPALSDDSTGFGARYGWARVTVVHEGSLVPGLFHGRLRGFAGSGWHRPPREQLFDVAEGSRLDELPHFYQNDRGPLRASGHDLVEGGGGLRGFTNRAGLGQRIVALNLDVTDLRGGAFVFGDVGRAEGSGFGEDSRPTDS